MPGTSRTCPLWESTWYPQHSAEPSIHGDQKIGPSSPSGRWCGGLGARPSGPPRGIGYGGSRGHTERMTHGMGVPGTPSQRKAHGPSDNDSKMGIEPLTPNPHLDILLDRPQLAQDCVYGPNRPSDIRHQTFMDRHYPNHKPTSPTPPCDVATPPPQWKMPCPPPAMVSPPPPPFGPSLVLPPAPPLMSAFMHQEVWKMIRIKPAHWRCVFVGSMETVPSYYTLRGVDFRSVASTLAL